MLHDSNIRHLAMEEGDTTPRISLDGSLVLENIGIYWNGRFMLDSVMCHHQGRAKDFRVFSRCVRYVPSLDFSRHLNLGCSRVCFLGSMTLWRQCEPAISQKPTNYATRWTLQRAKHMSVKNCSMCTGRYLGMMAAPTCGTQQLEKRACDPACDAFLRPD